MSFSVHVAETIGPIADSVSIEMTPADQAWDWCARWEQMLREFGDLTAPRTCGMSAEEIRAGRHHLQRFYVSTFHLKDALKKQTGRDVRAAIKTNPELALLADLANSAKHDGLDPGFTVHSGHEPRVKEVKGASLPGGGWRVVVTIDHNGKDLDGIEVAQAGIDAWRRVLTGWKLL
ncbi:MAG: hypothetical protein M3256_13770 [Actinomycetota bacterium]|nr:hypothetical protein [Actinomycetota bacterium]